MSTYGITRYGTDYYGPNRPITVVPGGSTLPLISNAYLIDPFDAEPVSYTSILLTWNGPDPSTGTPMTEFRLLSSRYGFPVDENDGSILFDVTTPPGSQYLDQNVVPGQLTYYGFYINSGSQWIRAGFTACLMPVNHDYASRLWSYLPVYLRDIENGELTADAAGDTYLSEFLQVAGFSLDWLKTQYDFLFQNQNNPARMAYNDLAALGAQLGVPFSTEIPAYFMRKAVANWATVMQQRGSLTGIAENADLVSGFGLDLQLARNIMLENDQSAPRHPRARSWSNAVPYNVGEIVSWPVYPPWIESQSYIVNNYVVYNGTNYQCIATGGQTVPPAGATSSGTYWAIAAGPYEYECISAITVLPGAAPPAVGGPGSAPAGSNSNWVLVYDYTSQPPYSSSDTYTLGRYTVFSGNLYVCIVGSVTGTAPSGTTAPNADWVYVGPAGTDVLAITGLTGGESTWEVLHAATSSTAPGSAAVAAGTLLEGLGMNNPANFTNDYSQNAFRVTNRAGSAADAWVRTLSRGPADVTAGNVSPDPQLVIEHAIPVPQPGRAWVSGTRYATGSVVSHGGRNYLAQRASTGAVPPSLGVPLNANWDFETTISPWTVVGNGLNGTTVSAVTTSAHSYHGSHSVAITVGGSPTVSTNAGIGSEQIPVIPGATYEASGWALVPSSPVAVNIIMLFYDAFGQYITYESAYVVPALSTWTEVAVTGTAPANAATVAFWFYAYTTGTGAPYSASFYGDLLTCTCTATPEWLPLGTDERIPLVISTETIQNMAVMAAEQYAITPYVEWYDNWGNLITRAVARTTTPGTAGNPAGYTYDAFMADANMPLAGKTTDTADQTWLVSTGDWTVTGTGFVYPTGTAVALVTAALSCTQAVTFATSPASGLDSGLLFWYQSSSLYWHAGMSGLYYNNAGTWTEAAAYTSACQPGDRIYVVTSQTAPSVSVYRNFIGSYNGVTGNGLIALVEGLTVPVTAPTLTGAVGGTMAAGVYKAEVTYVTTLGETTGSAQASITTTVISPPATPAPTFVTTTGTVLAGVYKVEVTYVSASGETTASAFGSVTTTGSTSKITIPSPASATGATGWYAYVTQAGGSTYTRQQTLGSPTAIGTSLVISAPPTSSGANPPVANTSGTSEVTITSPAATAGATGWYAYVSQVGGSTLTRQQTLGSPTAIGTNLTLTAPPTSSGANPPGSNTSGLGIPSAMLPSGTVFSGIASEAV